MDDLKLIKKHYGESMMHLCRKLFPTILEKKGLLFNILKENFAYSKFLYEDLKKQDLIYKFKDYVYSLVDVEDKVIITNKTPSELLSDAGYILYECNTEEDIQKFKKYYEKDEELCTFYGGRLSSCYVFFAVKKDVDEILREKFSIPMRQDKYGTSVISIQFSRGNINTLSIKNRYNHTVSNPDATFSNNLDNIVPGLTNSFEKYYYLNINQSNKKIFELKGYVLANDGKYYKYNHEINNIYYCPNNVVIKDFEVINKYQEKEKYLVIDYFVIDLMNKKIESLDNRYKDSFLDELKFINKINIINNGKSKTIKINYKENRECTIEIDKYNNIISYENKFIEKLEDNFLVYNSSLENISLPNVKLIKDKFLCCNNTLKKIFLPNVKEIGYSFMKYGYNIETLELPEVIKIGNTFLYKNNKLKEINLPNAKEIGSNFLGYNNSVITIDMPKVEYIHDKFLASNDKVRVIKLPKTKEIGHDFFYNNQYISNLKFPELIRCGENFLPNSPYIETVDFPQIKETGNRFLISATHINKLSMPSIEKIGDYFLTFTNKIEELDLSNLKEIGDNFLKNVRSIKKIDLPKVVKIGESFFSNCYNIEEINLPNLKEIEDYFLYSSIDNIKYIYMPNLSEKSIKLLGLDKDIRRNR